MLLVLVLMAGFRMSAEKAGLFGYLACLIVGTTFFGVNLPILYYGHLRGAWFALDVLLIIWASYLFYLVLEEAEIVTILETKLPLIAPDQGMQALTLGWIFASFLQGIGGFGVPVAVIAPMLIKLGFTPLQAVLIPSVGHGWGVTFGSLGSSFRALLAMSGHPIYPLNVSAAFLLFFSCLLGGGICLILVGGLRELFRYLGWVISGGIVMGGGMFLSVWFGVWNLGTFLGAIAGFVWFLVSARFAYGHLRIDRETLRELGIAFSGFGVLTGVILAANFVPCLRALLHQAELSLIIPTLRTAPARLSGITHTVTGAQIGPIAIFGHPGMVLFYGIFLVAAWFWSLGRLKRDSVWRITRKLIGGVKSTTVGVWAMVTLSVLMEMSGMTDAVARGLGEVFSGIYPVVSLGIGAIGAFLSGSNTNSNVLFAPLQMQIARLLGYPTAVILAAQTAAASIASTLAPAKIIVGTSTTGLKGQEGLVLRKLIPLVSLQLLMLAALVYFLLWIERVWQ